MLVENIGAVMFVLLITAALVYAGGLFLSLKEVGSEYKVDFLWPVTWVKKLLAKKVEAAAEDRE